MFDQISVYSGPAKLTSELSITGLLIAVIAVMFCMFKSPWRSKVSRALAKEDIILHNF